MHYRFHANVYHRPLRLVRGEPLVLRGVQVTPLREPGGAPPTFDQSLAVSFEQAFERLASLSRLDAEPDGFFVQSGEVDGRRWQLNGHLFDFGGRLHRLELHGQCPEEALAVVLNCLNLTESNAAFELVYEGVALGESDFRQWAGASE